jgi:sulfate adenylyltransferase
MNGARETGAADDAEVAAADDAEIAAAAGRLEGSTPLAILQWATQRFAPRLAFATAFGPEGLVILDLVARHRLQVDVFTLDTGLFFAETYELWRSLEERYGLRVRAVRPRQTVEEQREEHGEALWARAPDRCCELRKLEPLSAALDGHRSWVSAIRRDQTPDRAGAGVVERDRRNGMVKVNPLAAWSARDVWLHLREHDVPQNPLHAKGYPSIGCWPCTGPVAAGENPRAGRWRGRPKTECGLHTRVPAARRPATVTAPSPTPAQEADESGRSRGPRLDPRGARTMSEAKALPPSLESPGTATESHLVPPHGGVLVERIVSDHAARTLRREAALLPTLRLDPREIADLELLATGAASPLAGFLGSVDFRSVLDHLRLADGTVWPLPLTLAIADEDRGHATPGSRLALHDASGRLWGAIDVEEVFERDPRHEASRVYGTEDAAHPGVAYLLSRPRTLVAGPVSVLPLPEDLPFAEHRLTPRQLRSRIAERGWRTVAGFQTRNPIHRAHEHLTKLALEFADGLVIHPLVGETKQDDVPAAVRFRAYEALLERYYPRERTLLAAFPAAMRYAGPREALFHALVRKNYGITHLIVGRDHAGVGRFYGPYDAQRIFDRFAAHDLGVSPLRFEPTFFCHDCDSLASPRTCPHDETARLELSGTRVREILRSGGRLPAKFTRPEVAAVLRGHFNSPGATAAGSTVEASPAAPAEVTAGTSASATRGPIVWFTGLSGAGKSTLAQALRERLLPHGPVEILDGDEVRLYLSRGLGFSKEDRDTNVRRIGYVARLLARNGVTVITAAISPYREVRDEVRRLAAAEGTPFFEVYAEASIEALATRDVKGLYARALRGEITHFTGVSDPYEPPLAPEVTAFTDRESVAVSLGRIEATLEERGLLGASPTGSEAAENVA